MKYVRKTEGLRREPGGLLRAVLMLVGDGYAENYKIAVVLDTSSENVNGALGRLASLGYVVCDRNMIPYQWEATEAGMVHLRDEVNWL